MCQLFGMSSRQLATIHFSLEGFMRRGGGTDHHSDGWGVAFLEESGFRIYSDSLPSISSPVAEMLCQQPIKSRSVIAHIRKATRGEVAMQNCHPFSRQLWGRNWVFAHNGTLENYSPRLHDDYLPYGETDSEQAFCQILQGLREHFGARAPSQDALHEKLYSLSSVIAERGPFNYLLSEGSRMFAYCSTELSFLQRQAPFGQAHLLDCDKTIDFSLHNGQDDCMVLIATKPITGNENWQALKQGELKQFIDGEEQ